MTPSPLMPNDSAMAQREARLTTILLIARLSTESRDDLCRVRNLSSGGMRIETLSPVSMGARASVELKNGATVEGVVVWSKHPEIGLRFDQPVDISELLKPPVRNAAAHLPRSLRLATRCPVIVRRDGHLMSGVLKDISLGGARISLSGTARAGDQVMLGIPGLDSRRATVRWAKSGLVGLAFSEVIAFEELSRWLSTEQRQTAVVDEPLSPTRQSS
ncbi:PilZ domain-containing protein [Sphingomonas sp. HMP6]|uniref:PilZ domain-containing protein n=1 Tax=Sphingomonas sp. HMP6 TaxID=1517551 RepID=UPI001596B810|nr:PilZ domain-containing protein [Sphingomonas sp. HMP6]BCA58933.1 hypothetical protein HMP06_1702 [Sphingomonas sp. HMP6]